MKAAVNQGKLIPNETARIRIGQGSNQGRLHYNQPKLSVFGPVSALTRGGSGNVMEGMAMTAMRRFP